jgi:hypothetical protein
MNGTSLGSDVSDGHLEAVVDERRTVNIDTDKRSSVFSSGLDLRPNISRCEAVSGGERHLMSASMDESLNERRCIEHSFEGSGTFECTTNKLRSVNEQQQREKNRWQNSRFLSHVRRLTADAEGLNSRMVVNSNETKVHPDSSSSVENENVGGKFETEAVNAEDINQKESDELKAVRKQQSDEPIVRELNHSGQTDERQQVGLSRPNDYKDEFTRLARIDLSVINPKFYLPGNVECSVLVNQQKADDKLKLFGKKQSREKEDFLLIKMVF